MKLGRFFTLEELAASETASRLKISNKPTEAEIENLRQLVQKVLDPLRSLYGKPILVTSGFRSTELNAAVGGVSKSQHLCGQAADIVSASGPYGNRRLLGLILQNAFGIPFDQCIAEMPDRKGRPRWIHISWAPNPRGEILFR